MTTTVLFTRDGNEHTGKVSSDDKGKPYFITVDPCHRCNGVGGWNGWPNFTCFRCGGRGKEEPRRVRLYTAEQIVKIKAANEKRATKKAAAAAEKAKAAEIARDARRATFVEQYGDLLCRTIDICGEDSFAASVAKECLSRAAISPAQIELLECSIAETKRKAAAQYVGEVGERRDFVCTINKIMDWSNDSAHAFPKIYRYCHLMTDASGNAIKYVGSSYLGQVGDTVKFKATITEHNEYQGEKQTTVARPKVEQKEKIA